MWVLITSGGGGEHHHGDRHGQLREHGRGQPSRCDAGFQPQRVKKGVALGPFLAAISEFLNPTPPNPELYAPKSIKP